MNINEYEDAMLMINNIKSDLDSLGKIFTETYEKTLCKHEETVLIGGLPQCSECGKAF